MKVVSVNFRLIYLRFKSQNAGKDQGRNRDFYLFKQINVCAQTWLPGCSNNKETNLFEVWCYKATQPSRGAKMFEQAIIGKLRCHNHSNINWILKHFVWFLSERMKCDFPRSPRRCQRQQEVRVICTYLHDSWLTQRAKGFTLSQCVSSFELHLWTFLMPFEAFIRDILILMRHHTSICPCDVNCADISLCVGRFKSTVCEFRCRENFIEGIIPQTT